MRGGPRGRASSSTALLAVLLAPGNEDTIYVAPTAGQADRARLLAATMATSPEQADASRFVSADAKNLPKAKKGASARFVVENPAEVLAHVLGGTVLTETSASSGVDRRAEQAARRETRQAVRNLRRPAGKGGAE